MIFCIFYYAVYFKWSYYLLSAQYQCRIESGQRHDLRQVHSLLKGVLHLRVIVPATDGQPEVVSTALSWPFKPAFYLLTTELQLSNLLPVNNLRLQANPETLGDLSVSIDFVS